MEKIADKLFNKKFLYNIDEKNLLKKMLQKYGTRVQLLKVAEELNELSKEIIKIVAGCGSIDNLNEEFEDVKIVLNYLEFLGYGSIEIHNKKIKRIKKLV